MRWLCCGLLVLFNLGAMGEILSLDEVDCGKVVSGQAQAQCYAAKARENQPAPTQAPPAPQRQSATDALYWGGLPSLPPLSCIAFNRNMSTQNRLTIQMEDMTPQRGWHSEVRLNVRFIRHGGGRDLASTFLSENLPRTVAAVLDDGQQVSVSGTQVLQTDSGQSLPFNGTRLAVGTPYRTQLKVATTGAVVGLSCVSRQAVLSSDRRLDYLYRYPRWYPYPYPFPPPFPPKSPQKPYHKPSIQEEYPVRSIR